MPINTAWLLRCSPTLTFSACNVPRTQRHSTAETDTWWQWRRNRRFWTSYINTSLVAYTALWKARTSVISYVLHVSLLTVELTIILQVMKSISEARSSEINKLCSIAGNIFDLPGIYFSNTQYCRADVAEIQKMLGVSAANLKYKTFPPVLFLGMQEDPTLKTVFRNWELLAKVCVSFGQWACYCDIDISLNRFWRPHFAVLLRFTKRPLVDQRPTPGSGTSSTLCQGLLRGLPSL